VKVGRKNPKKQKAAFAWALQSVCELKELVA
jgi:hypothetical protein